MRSPETIYLVPAAMALCLTVAGSGHALTIANAGFEDFVLAEGQFSAQSPCDPNAGSDCVESADPIPGWQAYGSEMGTLHPSLLAFSSGAPEGQNVVYLNNYESDVNTISQIGQSLTGTLEPGEYTLSLDVGNPANESLARWYVWLYATNVLNERIVWHEFPEPQPGSFETISTTFVVSGPIDLDVADARIYIGVFLGSGGWEGQVVFDNLRIVPEPTSALLVGLGLCAFALMRRDAKPVFMRGSA